MTSSSESQSDQPLLKALRSLLEMVPPYQLRQTIVTLFFRTLLPGESPPPTPDQIRDVQLLIDFLDKVERS